MSPGPSPSAGNGTGFGPNGWFLLHHLGRAHDAQAGPLAAPPLSVLRALGESLPCDDCRQHFAQMLVELPPAPGPHLFEWSVMAHNLVNRRLGKRIMPLAEAEALYTPAYADAEADRMWRYLRQAAAAAPREASFPEPVPAWVRLFLAVLSLDGNADYVSFAAQRFAEAQAYPPQVIEEVHAYYCLNACTPRSWVPDQDLADLQACCSLPGSDPASPPPGETGREDCPPRWPWAAAAGMFLYLAVLLAVPLDPL